MKYVSPKDIMALLKKQGCRCAYTGDHLAPDTATADHVIPVSAGGTHDLDNLRIVTKEVNRAKNTLGLEEFVALCRKVVEHFDRVERGEPLAASEMPQPTQEADPVWFGMSTNGEA